MSKLTVFCKLVIALGIPMIALSCCLLVGIVISIVRTIAVIRRTKTPMPKELDTGKVSKAAKEYFTQPYEENRESSVEQDKVVR